MKLQGKKALITGSRRGIGRAIALRLAEDGADIGINDIIRDETAEETLQMVRDLGSNVSWHEANVGKSADINRMMDEFIAEHGRIDILVNNAVGSIKNSFLDITEEDWDFEIGNALKGPFPANQRAAREMIAQGRGGRLVSIASVHAFWAKPYNLVYSIAKHGPDPHGHEHGRRPRRSQHHVQRGRARSDRLADAAARPRSTNAPGPNTPRTSRPRSRCEQPASPGTSPTRSPSCPPTTRVT